MEDGVLEKFVSPKMKRNHLPTKKLVGKWFIFQMKKIVIFLSQTFVHVFLKKHCTSSFFWKKTSGQDDINIARHLPVTCGSKTCLLKISKWKLTLHICPHCYLSISGIIMRPCLLPILSDEAPKKVFRHKQLVFSDQMLNI